MVKMPELRVEARVRIEIIAFCSKAKSGLEFSPIKYKELSKAKAMAESDIVRIGRRGIFLIT